MGSLFHKHFSNACGALLMKLSWSKKVHGGRPEMILIRNIVQPNNNFAHSWAATSSILWMLLSCEVTHNNVQSHGVAEVCHRVNRKYCRSG